MNDNPAGIPELIGPCPTCGNGRLATVIDDEGTTNVLCRVCGACWHSEFDWSRRVDPRACPGCAARAVCRAGATEPLNNGSR